MVSYKFHATCKKLFKASFARGQSGSEWYDWGNTEIRFSVRMCIPEKYEPFNMEGHYFDLRGSRMSLQKRRM